jgi:succinate dehydrogenase / fumarate reductase iron-sulfur subunit
MGECEAACPKEIPISFIAGLNRDLLQSPLRRAAPSSGGGAG